jgi:hypothetical protein
VLSPDGDDRETKGWRDDDRGHGRHWHGPKLIVDQDKGTVGEDDPCPTPRTSAFYLIIQAAIDCSKSGDTIKIRPGRYTENQISITGGKIRIVGSGPYQTILFRGDGGFTVFSGQAVIENLTLVSGNASDGGGFDNEPDGDVTIKDCVFAGNSASIGGGLVNYGKMHVYNSVFVNNDGTEGGAIADSGDLKIFRTTIVGNTASMGGGIFNSSRARPLTVVKSLISENEGALSWYSESLLPCLHGN